MIKDIPSNEEFDSAAKAQFDFAWGTVISFLLMIDQAEHWGGVDKEDKDNFWETARQRILTSLIIAQQGVELAIKGKLVSVSPYLLISGNPSEWPKDTDGTGVSFSEFRAIDAQDLIKVHDTVYETKFDEEFSVLFENLRKLRNKAMHTVDKQLNVTAQEVIVILLEVHEYIYPGENWMSTRRDFLFDSPDTQLYSDTEHVAGQVAREFLVVFKFLERAQIKRFFKFDKRQRLYSCPECSVEIEKHSFIDPKYAVLRPNAPDSEHIFCFVCDELHQVRRDNCNSETCPGNVISLEYDCCCTCGAVNEVETSE